LRGGQRHGGRERDLSTKGGKYRYLRENRVEGGGRKGDTGLGGGGKEVEMS